MNRRNFFNKLGSFVVGCYLASGFESLAKIVPTKETIAVINPEWVNAPYEIAWFTYELTPEGNKKLDKPEHIIFKRTGDCTDITEYEKALNKLHNKKFLCYNEAYPIRMNEKGEILCPIK